MSRAIWIALPTLLAILSGCTETCPPGSNPSSFFCHADAGLSDFGAPDALQLDAHDLDGHGLDAQDLDAAAVDGGLDAAMDTGAADGSLLPDLAVPDLAVPDSSLPDVGVSDLSLPDVGVSDLSLPDVGVADLSVPDLGVPDLGMADLCAGVTCTALDACHTVGTCDPATGVCSSPTRADGSGCDDGSACTTGDSCMSGACMGSVVMCTPLDSCHVAGTCSATSGCSNPNVPDGTPCMIASGPSICVSGACVAGCTDGVRDGAETGVDCGGSACPTCPSGSGCAIDRDCTTAACDAISLTCVANQCMDHRIDGAETSIDCGGGICPTCPTGSRCSIDSDCTTAACDAVALVCVPSQCMDHRVDGAETDVDCGGASCPHCIVGNRCATGTDCLSSACSAVTHRCVATACTDGTRDGAETGVDCGGGICPACPVGDGCSIDTDCMSTACDAVSLTCVGDQCMDHRQDGLETDVDCGNLCGGCLAGQHCVLSSDCASHLCFGLPLVCH